MCNVQNFSLPFHRKLANKKRIRRKRRRNVTEDILEWEYQIDPFKIWEDINILTNRKHAFLAALKGYFSCLLCEFNTTCKFLENDGAPLGVRTKVMMQTYHKVDNWNILKTRLVSARMKVNIHKNDFYLKHL